MVVKPFLLTNEIGRLIGGIDYSAVSQARKRLQFKLEHEAKLKKRFDSVALGSPRSNIQVTSLVFDRIV